MISKITQKTLRVILPSKVALTVEEIASRIGSDSVRELPRFYASSTYRALENEKSKYWWFSPAELCDLFLKETSTHGDT